MTESEYLKAFKEFLQQISANLGISNNNFVFCLGNHDKSRDEYAALLAESKVKTFNAATNEVKEGVERTSFIKATDREVFDGPVIEELLKVKGRNIFINPYELLEGCKEPNFRGENNYLVGIKYLDGIAYACLNSSWLCGEKIGSGREDGNLSLGKSVTDELLKELKSGYDEKLFTIGLMHHNFSSLSYSNYLPQPGEDKSLASRVLQACQLLLIGHEHGEMPVMMGDVESYILRAGTFLSKEDLKGYNAFSILEIDFESERIYKTPYKYSESSKNWEEYTPFQIALEAVKK